MSMNININIDSNAALSIWQDILNFLRDLSFKISFRIAIIITVIISAIFYKKSLLSSTVAIFLILFVIPLITLFLKPIIKIIITKMTATQKKKNILKTLSDEQIRILLIYYFDMPKCKLKRTNYLSSNDKSCQLLLKGLIFQDEMESVYTSSEYDNPILPYYLQDDVYDELEKAIKRGKIKCNKQKRKYIIKWYRKQITLKKI